MYRSRQIIFLSALILFVKLVVLNASAAAQVSPGSGAMEVADGPKLMTAPAGSNPIVPTPASGAGSASIEANQMSTTVPAGSNLIIPAEINEVAPTALTEMMGPRSMVMTAPESMGIVPGNSPIEIGVYNQQHAFDSQSVVSLIGPCTCFGSDIKGPGIKMSP